MDFGKMKDFMHGLTDWIIPGNSMVVYKDNKKVFEYHTGYSNLEEKKPMNGSELLNIYSCSKVATVVAALQLYEKGIYLMTDPLYDYIPEFKEMYIIGENGELKKAENPITIQNLFTMTAGFDYDFNSPIFKEAAKITNGKMDTVKTMKLFSKKPLLFEPGTRWNYSFCHDMLGALVEILSGKRFSEYMKENVFLPLGMNETYFHSTPEIESRMAEQYKYFVEETNLIKLQMGRYRENGVVKNVTKKNECYIGSNFDSGGAGIISSVNDYAKLANALANKGVGTTGEKILSGNTIDLMRTNHFTKELDMDSEWPDYKKGYGYGLGVHTMVNKASGGSNGSLGEFGWGGAAGASILVDPDLNLSFFYSHHMLNPQEDYYQSRLRNVLYSCI